MRESGVKTIEDLARLMGLSKSTVSRALNGNPVIAEETRRRVAETARDHQFSKNVSAQRLTNRASKTIAFVTHNIADGCQASDLFGFEIMGGVSQGLHELGYEMLIKAIDYKDYSWVRKLLDSGQVDGFVLMTSTRKTNHIKNLILEKAPFITWGATTNFAAFPSVCADDFQGGKLVGTYLSTLGGPLAVIGGPSDEGEVQNRLAGFTAALSETQTPFRQEYLRYGDYSEESGTAAMADLLAQKVRPRGVFAHSDLMAIGAMKAVRDQGLSIPREVAIVGFDDLMLASYVSPPLTTVRQHIPEAGRALAQGLVRFLETGQVSHVVMPVELVRRGSA